MRDHAGSCGGAVEGLASPGRAAPGRVGVGPAGRHVDVLLPGGTADPDAALGAGLAAIGTALESGETDVATIWALYETPKKTKISIMYPRTYNIKTDGQRTQEAKDKKELKDATPSKTYQKEISKQIAKDLLELKVSAEIFEKIKEEIDSADIILSDLNRVIESHKEGLIDDKSAAEALGYPEGTIEKARIDHALRIARIQQAQSSDDNQARGVDDLSANPQAGEQEKELNNGNGIVRSGT